MVVIVFILAVVAHLTSADSHNNTNLFLFTLEDEFDTFNLSLWKHEITLSGGGNWKFQAYLNNRFVRDGVLYINQTNSIGGSNWF